VPCCRSDISIFFVGRLELVLDHRVYSNLGNHGSVCRLRHCRIAGFYPKRSNSLQVLWFPAGSLNLSKSRGLNIDEFAPRFTFYVVCHKDELQKLIFKGLKGTGKKREYIEKIVERKNDPYSVVEEVLNIYLVRKS